MPHEHEFQLDLDGQVTCVMCGSMDDDMNVDNSLFETQMDFE
jgi:hypothetical protein